jgi:hypothetical protein
MNMRALLFGAAASVTVALGAAPASATTYVYVGNWILGDGPVWTTNPPVYSGVETAALLFGGSASQYAISTVDNIPADINFKTWLDGWADSYTYANSGSPASDTYSLDTGGSGYNSNPGYQTAYSAYVADHFNPAWGGQNSAFTNYAFKAVPEASTWAMMGLGFVGLAFAGFRSRRAAAAIA